MADNIYKYEDKLDKEIRSIKLSNEITEANKELIFKFIEKIELMGLSVARRVKLLNRLKHLAKKVREDFQNSTKDDVNKLAKEIMASPLSPVTIMDDLRLLKRFYKWFTGEDDPEQTRDIQFKNHIKKRAPSEILNEDDILKLIEVSESVRNKAIIAVLADSGLRIGEILSIKIKNIEYGSDDLVRLYVETGKTGGRVVLLIPSVPYLMNWINNHPSKEEKESYLFVGLDKRNYGNQLAYSSVNVLLYKVSKRAGIEKKCNPHAFRRFSATNSSKFMSDTELMMRYGWSRRQTVSSYTFIHPKQAETAYKRGFGKEEKEIEESKMIPKSCAICKHKNEATNDFCSRCGKPLSLKIAIENKNKEEEFVIEFIQELLKDPATKEKAEKILMAKNG